MDCLSEHGIAAFVDGRLDEPQRAAVEQHLDACSDCARLVVEFARVFSDRMPGESAVEAGETTRVGAPDSVVMRDDAGVLRAGTCVGRYRVLECVGRGGMGVVYGAYDPELDRRVALKLLRGRAARDAQRNARLLREAQAMARLSHPNVITVHDVGTHVLEGGDPDKPLVYLAMEFVRGCTLGTWVRARRRSWSELRVMCIAAGRGLEAAHAAGLVHRDFKPDNVLVGDDGRVRVTDFGLARFFDTTTSEEVAVETPVPSGTVSTRTGTVLGTPAYMAPEQHRGGKVGPASDQFSFCVTVFEAAYGVRPFAGRTVVELAANVDAGEVRNVPARSEVPGRVHDALLRGLAADPQQRFVDMTALLAELDGERKRTVRRASIIALPLGIGLAAWAVLAPQHPRAIAFCRDAEALDVAWSGEQRQAMHAALAGTGLVYANATADAVAERLDGWVEDWSTQRQEVCSSHDASAADPEIGTVLRVQCLRRGRAAFQATVDVLSSADTEAVRQALVTIEKLAAPASCASAALGDLPPDPPPDRVEAVESVRERVARVETLLWGGQWDEADAELVLARAQADEIGFAPLDAEVTLFEGRALLRRGDVEVGTRRVEDAAWDAVEARDRSVAVRAFTALAYAHGVQRQALGPARQAIRAARAELRALGGDAWLEANLWLNEGGAELTASNFTEAREAFTAALGTGVFDSRPMSHADLLMNLASVSSELHEFDDAIATMERARVLYEEQVGPQHPAVGSVFYNLGATLFRKGDYTAAIEHIERASAIEVATIGARHPIHANTLGALGVALSAAGRADEGVAPLRDSVAILEEVVDPLDSTLALQRVNLASTLFEAGRLDEAEPIARRGHADLLARLGPDQVELATAEQVLGMFVRARGDLKSAEAHFRRALEIRNASFPPTHGDVLFAQVALAEIVAERGRSSEAIELLDEIVARHPDLTTAPDELAFARFLAARERLTRGDDADAARLEMAAALARLRAIEDSARVLEAETWLRAHPDVIAGR
jgi:tetratricopeptide (TPR) repeat protein/tRNA A-37 threonylcarbamoyl transferase component Bud32